MRASIYIYIDIIMQTEREQEMREISNKIYLTQPVQYTTSSNDQGDGIVLPALPRLVRRHRGGLRTFSRFGLL
jgi:hypothetical protein